MYLCSYVFIFSLLLHIWLRIVLFRKESRNIDKFRLFLCVPFYYFTIVVSMKQYLRSTFRILLQYLIRNSYGWNIRLGW